MSVLGAMFYQPRGSLQNASDPKLQMTLSGTHPANKTQQGWQKSQQEQLPPQQGLLSPGLTFLFKAEG